MTASTRGSLNCPWNSGISMVCSAQGSSMAVPGMKKRQRRELLRESTPRGKFREKNRSEAYIGVLIDDLVTKENHEPYRMMTSRAEYRLLLRQDNADLRLTSKGYEVGLISEERYQRLLEKQREIQEETERVKNTWIGTGQKVQEFLRAHESTELRSSVRLSELICRPELSYQKLCEIDADRKELPDNIQEQVNINIKYEGYLLRQIRQVEQFKKMEERKIPQNLDYDKVPSLRTEARQKLKESRPASIGQASRIAGVSPADVSILMVYLHSNRKV